jgi:hypothetical protein
MFILDIIILTLLIYTYQRTADKFNSNRLLWIIYAIMAFILGFILAGFYTITIHDFIVEGYGKDIAIGLFIFVTIALELLVGFSCLYFLKWIYFRKKNQ